MFRKIQKVEKALIDAGIDYDYSLSFDSRSHAENEILKWRIEGRLFTFIEDEEGYTSFRIGSPKVSDVIAIIEKGGLEGNQVPMIMESILTNRVFIVTSYQDNHDGTFTARQKYDMTKEFDELARQRRERDL